MARMTETGTDMTIRLIRCVALAGLLVSAPATGRAQDAASTSLRVRWDVDQPVSGLLTVCGRVFNDRPMTAVRVRVRAEGLDERGGVVSRREGQVLGQISSGSAGLFCITMAAGPVSYRVTVISADWTGGTDGP